MSQATGLNVWAALVQREIRARRRAPEASTQPWAFVHLGTTVDADDNATPSMIARTVGI